MAIIDLKYKLDEAGIEIMMGCSASHLISEIKEAVAHAYREVTISIDHDEDTGICRIVAVNNHNLCGCP